MSASELVVFFFQAEDGIRDVAVTGVQTCALPIDPNFQQKVVDGLASGISGVVDLANQAVQNKINSKLDRKSTRLNSSHGYISYAVFCLKKKKKKTTTRLKLMSDAIDRRARRDRD